MKKSFLLFFGFVFFLAFPGTLFSQSDTLRFTSTPVTVASDTTFWYNYLVATNNLKFGEVTVSAEKLPDWLLLKRAVNYPVKTLAGSQQGFANGWLSQALFLFPDDVALDDSGNVYVADLNNEMIRKITAVGQVLTLAGSGKMGFRDGMGLNAEFESPVCITVDHKGNVYVADAAINLIRKVSPDGYVTTLAGSGIAGYFDGSAAYAEFDNPQGLAVDDEGNVYVADTYNNRIRKISPLGNVTTLAGSSMGYADGTGDTAQFNRPHGLAIDDSGNLYVADTYNHRIRKVTPGGVVTTIAGGQFGFPDDNGSTYGAPYAITIDARGNLYVTDIGGQQIWKVSPSGTVEKIGGTKAGFQDGAQYEAEFNEPRGIAVTPSGRKIYVADAQNNRIREINPADSITVSGDPSLHLGTFPVVLEAKDGINGDRTFQKFDIIVSKAAAPVLRTVAPASGTMDFLVGGNLVMTFNESIRKGSGKIWIRDVSDGSTSDTVDVSSSLVSVSGPVVTIHPPSRLDKNRQYAVEVDSNAFQNLASTANSGISDLSSWYFTTESNHAPVFTSQPPTAVADTVMYHYRINTKDADGDVVSVSVPELPGWLSLVPVRDSSVTTVAGAQVGFLNGTGDAAEFNAPCDVAVDGAGNIYVADKANQRIRKITPDGTVTTLAGSGVAGSTDGKGAEAQFRDPVGVAVDASGNVYVADKGNNEIRKITPDGTVTTFCGSAAAGFADGGRYVARFNGPSGIAVDSLGTLFVSDAGNNSIRKITPAGVVSTLAGSGTAGYADGYGSKAEFNNPQGIAVDDQEKLFVADAGNNRIREVDMLGKVTTLAGNGKAAFDDGPGTAAEFNDPVGIAADGDGIVYVSDANDTKVRKITPSGMVSTFAGSSIGFSDGLGYHAQFSSPCGLAVDDQGNLFVADLGNNKIRKIVTRGVELTGLASYNPGNYKVTLKAADGFGGVATQTFEIDASLIPFPPEFTSTPVTEVSDTTDYDYYISTRDPNGERISVTAGVIPDWLSLVIRGGNKVTTLKSALAFGSYDGPGTDALFFNAYGVAVDKFGNVYVSDNYPCKIEKITPEGVVSVLAGYGPGYVDGPGPVARFNNPAGLAVDDSGNIFVADEGNNRIRKITQGGMVSTYAGSVDGYHDGFRTDAEFSGPEGLTIDDSGNLYVADSRNGRIRKISPSGMVTTVPITSFDGGTGFRNMLWNPGGVAVDDSGNIYIADTYNDKIRKVTPSGQDITLAGSTYGFADGTGAQAQFDQPQDLVVDDSGNVYVSDSRNNRIRRITPSGKVTTYAGSGTEALKDGSGVAAAFYHPDYMAQDAAGNLYVAEDDGRVRKINLRQLVLTGNARGHDGSYPVILSATNNDSLTTDQPFTIVVSGKVSGVPGYAAVGLKVFPNPVVNQLTVSSPQEIRSVQIFSLPGQEVLQKTVYGKQVVLDVGFLPRGTYVVKVTTTQQTLTRELNKE